MVMKINWDDLPKWVNWIAMDANGQWCTYSEKPYMDMCCLKWWSPALPFFDKLFFTLPPAPDWTRSLMKRPA